MCTSSDLPEDVLIDILSRLSAKSLVSLRCVSKSWCALIKSPNFISKHLHFNKLYNKESLLFVQQRQHDCVLSLHNNDGVIITNLADYDDQIKQIIDDSTKIVGSCNGIICLTDGYGGNVYLWNPSVKEFKSLPSPLSLHQFDDTLCYYYEYGFGFDPKTNDYKVLQIWSKIDHGNWENHVHIYTLSSDSWRKIDHDVPCSYLFSCVYKPHMNNSYYWIGCHKEGEEHSIISFEFGNEMFRKIELPPGVGVCDYCCYWGVTVLNESLAMVSSTDLVGGFIDVWVMNECGNNSWSKLTRFGPLLRVWDLSWRSGYFILQDIDDTLIFIDPAIPGIHVPGIETACLHFESLVSLTTTII